MSAGYTEYIPFADKLNLKSRANPYDALVLLLVLRTAILGRSEADSHLQGSLFPFPSKGEKVPDGVLYLPLSLGQPKAL